MIKVLKQYLFGVFINGVNSINKCLHSINLKLFHIRDLLLEHLRLDECALVLAALDVCSVKSIGDLILAEIVENSEVFILHAFLGESCLLELKHLSLERFVAVLILLANIHHLLLLVS